MGDHPNSDEAFVSVSIHETAAAVHHDNNFPEVEKEARAENVPAPELGSADGASVEGPPVDTKAADDEPPLAATPPDVWPPVSSADWAAAVAAPTEERSAESAPVVDPPAAPLVIPPEAPADPIGDDTPAEPSAAAPADADKKRPASPNGQSQRAPEDDNDAALLPLPPVPLLSDEDPRQQATLREKIRHAMRPTDFFDEIEAHDFQYHLLASSRMRTAARDLFHHAQSARDNYRAFKSYVESWKAFDGIDLEHERQRAAILREQDRRRAMRSRRAESEGADSEENKTKSDRGPV